MGNVASLTYPTKTVLKYKLVLFCQSLYPPKSSICDVTTVAVRISVTVTSRLSIRNLFVLACLFRESLSTKRKFKLKKFSWHFTMCQKMTLVWHFIKWRKINWTYLSWTKEEWCIFLFQKFWRLSKTHFRKVLPSTILKCKCRSLFTFISSIFTWNFEWHFAGSESQVFSWHNHVIFRYPTNIYLMKINNRPNKKPVNHVQS